MFRNVTLKCLTEIASVQVTQYEEEFVQLFTLTMAQLKQVGLLIQFCAIKMSFFPPKKPYRMFVLSTTVPVQV